MESSSQPNKIQVSRKTAKLVVEAGKSFWLTARKDLVNAKGKGLLQTYWLELKRSKTSGSVVTSVDELGTDDDDCCPSRRNDTKENGLERRHTNPLFSNQARTTVLPVEVVWRRPSSDEMVTPTFKRQAETRF
jgi:hypothetical protein